MRVRRDRHPFLNPFYAGQNPFGGGPTFHFDAESRLARVAQFNAGQCHLALKVKGLQKVVRTAIERRLRKLGAKA